MAAITGTMTRGTGSFERCPGVAPSSLEQRVLARRERADGFPLCGSVSCLRLFASAVFVCIGLLPKFATGARMDYLCWNGDLAAFMAGSR